MRYLIWSWEHGAWWGHASRGYVDTVTAAGRYSHDESARHTVGHYPPGEEVAVPEPWAMAHGRPQVFGAHEYGARKGDKCVRCSGSGFMDANPEYVKTVRHGKPYTVKIEGKTLCTACRGGVVV